jgi:hypothetical protein
VDNTVAKIEPQSVFKQGERFHWSYQRLCVGTHEDVHEMVLIPALALSAFASELFLKCLHHIDSGKVPERIHALQELFAALPESRRNRIEFLWDNHIVAHSAEYELIASRGVNIPKDLSTALADSSHGFVKLRYEYEDRNFKFYIAEFPNILRDAILEIQPTWRRELPPVNKGF